MKAKNKSELIAIVGVVLMGVGLSTEGGGNLVTAAAIIFIWSGFVGLFGKDR